MNTDMLRWIWFDMAQCVDELKEEKKIEMEEVDKTWLT